MATDNTTIRRTLAAATVRVMLPLVRYLLRNGVSYKTVAEWLRWCFVKVATEEFQLPGKRQTKSRVAVITGLTRVDVDRLQKTPAPFEDSCEVEEYQRAARVLSAWARDKQFLDQDGKPLRLPIDGQEPSFESLVAGNAGGAPMRAVLDDLVHVAAVRIEEDRVEMLKPHYVPRGGERRAAQANILAEAAGGLLGTIEHNTQSDCEETWLQGQAICPRIPESRAAEVRSHVKERGREFLYEMDDYLYQVALPDGAESDEATVEIGVGSYLFTTKD